MADRMLVGLCLAWSAAVPLAGAQGIGGLLEQTMPQAIVKDETKPGANVPAPTAIYVGQFTADPDAVKASGGLIGEGEGLLQERPRLLGGGGGLLGGEGPLQRRTAEDNPTPENVEDTIEDAIADGLGQQGLSMPTGRLEPGMTPPPGSWVVTGAFVSVDPGNRAERAAVGFGAGAATAQVDVSIDAVQGDERIPVARMDGAANSGKMPGGAVTLKPYVIAAKFVIGRKATARDLEKLGGSIAQDVGAKARAAGAS
jgi:hypothetical protein